jgi:multimeric flavodoxin WrbA
MSNAVKVLGLFGSPRRGGNTDLLLDEALKGAAAEGAAVEEIHLSDCRITPCRGCHRG